MYIVLVAHAHIPWLKSYSVVHIEFQHVVQYHIYFKPTITKQPR